MAEKKDISVDSCKRIVTLVHEASGHTVNVMGDGGKILASSDPARVGTIHDGAKRIMAGEVGEIAIDAEMAKTMQGVKPGYTGSVHIDGKLVACIGVGGDPVEVKPFQKMAALALRQEIDRDRMAARERSLLDDVRRDIGDIAERMQVLSLNGAVLAARLGEKGRGFKIVVGEMRNLAAQIGEKLADLERRDKANSAG
jgi:carbohydrate diacid regulator